jgi:ATP-dependent DNA ligase
VNEIKHDGYRLQVRRDGDAVRLFTRRGYDWSTRYPVIAGTAAQLRARSFTIDGEVAVCGPEGDDLGTSRTFARVTQITPRRPRPSWLLTGWSAVRIRPEEANKSIG